MYRYIHCTCLFLVTVSKQPTDASSVFHTCTCSTLLTICKCSLHRLTPAALSSSILWNDCKAVLVAGAGVGSGEGVVWLCEVVTISTGDGCWAVLICHIGDEDSVPDVRIHPCHIQGEGRAPGEEDGVTATLNNHITHWSQLTYEA